MSEERPGVERLAALTDDEDWKAALRKAPRELFIPERAWADPLGDDPGYWIDRAGAPDRWYHAVYGDTVIVTQIEDGRVELTEESMARPVNATSSSSAPSNVTAFLELLDPHNGDRVLEVGTGTGWTAALLAVRAGDHNVTSIEVDEWIADRAASNLERAGFAPTIAVADGAAGRPAGAPYDHVHVTCGVCDIPYAWVEQTRPGGVIVLPWLPGYGGHRLRLTVTGDEAVGRFHGDAGYMMLRSQRSRGTSLAEEERASTARVDPRRIARAGTGFQIAVMAMMPRTTIASGTGQDGGFLLVLSTDTSHALVKRDPGSSRARVVQRGPRDLWEEVEAAYLRWAGWGRPDASRFGLTVDPEGQHVWLDSPDNRILEVVDRG